MQNQAGNTTEIGFGTTAIDLNNYGQADGGAAATSMASGGNATNVPFSPEGGAQGQQSDTLGYKGVHPIAALFHVLFKIGALLMFILGNIFLSNFVLTFVITVLFMAADFWTTKNITGRILVALRWWNQVKDDGSSEWVFESSPDADSRVNAFDNWFFWVTTGGYCAAWVLMCLFNLMSPSKLTIAIIGLCLSGSNLMGYIKCRRDARSRVTDFMITQATQNPGVVTQAAAAAWGSGK